MCPVCNLSAQIRFDGHAARPMADLLNHVSEMLKRGVQEAIC